MQNGENSASIRQGCDLWKVETRCMEIHRDYMRIERNTIAPEVMVWNKMLANRTMRTRQLTSTRKTLETVRPSCTEAVYTDLVKVGALSLISISWTVTEAVADLGERPPSVAITVNTRWGLVSRSNFFAVLTCPDFPSIVKSPFAPDKEKVMTALSPLSASFADTVSTSAGAASSSRTWKL